ncbi:MAG: exonuclease domain-containing protein [Succinatimonas hippei]|nr:exonuclease domain-containing protein [Succinatimonas hippei]
MDKQEIKDKSERGELPRACDISKRFRGFLPVVVDVETAGFDPEKNALLEVAAMPLALNDKGIMVPGEIFSANIRPFEGSVLVEENLKFLGIDPYAADRNIQDEKESITALFRFVHRAVKAAHCKKALLTGHNGSFDLGFVNAAGRRAGLEKKNPFHPFTVLDTSTVGALVFGHTVLAKACMGAHINYEGKNAHGAAYDTKVEAELFCAAYNRFTTFCGLPEPIVEE